MLSILPMIGVYKIKILMPKRQDILVAAPSESSCGAWTHPSLEAIDHSLKLLGFSLCTATENALVELKAHTLSASALSQSK